MSETHELPLRMADREETFGEHCQRVRREAGETLDYQSRVLGMHASDIAAMERDWLLPHPTAWLILRTHYPSLRAWDAAVARARQALQLTARVYLSRSL